MHKKDNDLYLLLKQAAIQIVEKNNQIENN